jgi:lactate dehydrogenase-like 2-hydroxyacid dehydrogenase
MTGTTNPPRPAVLQMNALSPLLEQELGARFEVHRWFDLADREHFLSEHAASIRAVVTGGQVGLPNDLMDRLPSLGIVAINGVGYDKVDMQAAKLRGLCVSRTAGVLTEDVADLAVGLVIGLLRGIVASDRHVRGGLWPAGDPPLARKVSGKRFGIVGLGHVGGAIAQRLAIFGPVTYCNPTPKPVAYPFVDSIIGLAAASDVLILAASSNASTRGMVGREVLNALGPRGYLINVARGALVDEAELIDALQNHRIAGAALDVFVDEPEVPEALRNLPTVVLTPHIASATAETREAMARAVLANLDAFFAGQPVPGVIV